MGASGSERRPGIVVNPSVESVDGGGRLLLPGQVEIVARDGVAVGARPEAHESLRARRRASVSERVS
jgi:hypothetical protein